MSKLKYIVLENVNTCPKCFIYMQQRKHKVINDKIKRQAYYFSEWDVCTTCGHVQLYEKYKVLNRNDLSVYIQDKEHIENLFKNL